MLKKIISVLFSFHAFAVLLLALWSFYSIAVSAQTFEMYNGDTVNRTDAAGLKQGKWVITNKTKNLPEYGPEQVIEIIHFADGKKEGLRTQYYPSNKVKSEITYQGNFPKGKSRTYYPNGVLSEEGVWKNGGWDGVYRFYYDNGNLSYEWNFVNGKRDGEQKYYFENGKLNYIGMWKNGSESGVMKEYNDSGLLVAEKNFNEGKIDEASSVYYSTPKPDPTLKTTSETGQSKEDNIGVFSGNGFFKLKTKNGQPSKEGNFTNGQLVEGKQFQYSSDGKLIRTIIYKEGKILQTIEEK